ncbi:hypothetical protein [Undibacterium sp. YM2]|uniref:hypothetical protein n=1 Tax=Undibacterium sp. YM2 TaxID=2058625 RepID=UPI001389DC3D|nr:hypothetical protein [Undibacterium sp. YM2]
MHLETPATPQTTDTSFSIFCITQTASSQAVESQKQQQLPRQCDRYAYIVEHDQLTCVLGLLLFLKLAVPMCRCICCTAENGNRKTDV